MTWIEGRKSIWKISVSFRFQVVPTLTRVCSFWLLNTTLSPLSSSLHTEDEQVSAVWGDNVLVQTLDVPPPPGVARITETELLTHPSTSSVPASSTRFSLLIGGSALLCSALLTSLPCLKASWGVEWPCMQKILWRKRRRRDGRRWRGGQRLGKCLALFFFFFWKDHRNRAWCQEVPPGHLYTEPQFCCCQNQDQIQTWTWRQKSQKLTCNSTASWRVDLHLHFVIFYFLKKTKSEQKQMCVEMDRTTTVYLTPRF